MQTLTVPKYTDGELEKLPVPDEKLEAYMRTDKGEIPIEEVKFFLPEFSV